MKSRHFCSVLESQRVKNHLHTNDLITDSVCVCVCVCVCACVCVCVITDDTLIINSRLFTAASLLSVYVSQTVSMESGCHGDSRISDFIWGDNLWCAPFLSDSLQLFPRSGFRKQVSIWVSIATRDIMGCVYMIHWCKHRCAECGPNKPQRHMPLASKTHVWNTERQLQYYAIWKHV